MKSFRLVLNKLTPSRAISITFNQATVQTHGAATTYYSGAVQCNIYVPKNKGTSVLSAVGELVISGLTSINASDYTDTFSCKPRVGEVSGPIPIEVEDRSYKSFRRNW